MESPPQTRKPTVNPIGFSVLYDPANAIADIVFVHGLQGHPRKTWTCKKASAAEPQSSRHRVGSPHRTIRNLFRVHKDEHKVETEEVFWPLDLLPEDCVNSRILTWGYDSMVSHFFGGPTNQSNISAHAKNLLEALKHLRRNCPGRSLVFVAHSLGGIIVKNALYRGATSSVPVLTDIYASTEAILFLGTPHRGSGKAGIGEVVRRIVSVSGFDTSDRNIRALQVNSSELEWIHEYFMQLYDQKDRRFKVLTFQETKGITGISYFKANERVVEPFSSSFTGTETTQTINANHMAMCRFPSRDDEGYKQVSGELQHLVLEVQENLEYAARKKEGVGSRWQAASPSEGTTASASYSLTDVERKCVALLVQNTANAAEYKSSLPHPVDGTCQWILSHAQYRDWNLQRKSCLLEISGYPRSGKTILSAYLLEYLAAGGLSPSMTLCYFFCDEKIATQRDGLAILRSLIHQLLLRRRLLVKHVKKAYDYYGPQYDQNFNELWRIFIAIASDRQVGTVCVIVDAIDECEGATRERFLRDVSELIRKSNANGSQAPCIKFLVTSRPRLGHQYYTHLLQIDQEHIEQDLRLVIQTKVDIIAQRTQCNPDVRRYLEKVLYSKADCTFLWVTLVLHLLEISLLASQKDFKRIIDEVPRTLTATYERFLLGIPAEHQTLATKLLHFLVGSSRPLTLDEMQILIATQSHHRNLAAVEEDTQPNIRQTIEGILGPLVRIWDNQIHLVHQSPKEFLLDLSNQKSSPLATIYSIDLSRASLLLAEVCISYLSLDDFNQDLFSIDQSVAEESPTSQSTASSNEPLEQSLDPFNLEEDILFKDATIIEEDACTFIGTKYTFFAYSARYWAEHFSTGYSTGTSELQETAILLSDANSAWGLNWLRFYWLQAETDLPCPRNFTAFVTACYFGHTTSLETILRKSLPIESDAGALGLYWASRKGHYEIVKLLLREGFDPDLKILNDQTAFMAAICFNHLDVVKCLLDNEDHISQLKDSRVNHTTIGNRTALSISAGNGFVELVGQLLQHRRLQPDIADSQHWTPIFWAVNGKHLKVLKLLLKDLRISINHMDKFHRNILSWAASGGDHELVRFLLNLEELNANETDQNGRTPLSWAAGNGHLETTMCLRRSQRIDIRRKDKDGRNAISWACSGGHHKVVEYMIKYDRQGVDEEDIDGWTPLAWALFKQSVNTVQVLLDSGFVDVNKKDRNGRSPLSFAAGYGYLDVVKLFLGVKDIEIESVDNQGRKPLSYATAYPDIVDVFRQAQKEKL